MPGAISRRPALLALLVLLTPAMNLAHFALKGHTPMPFESEAELVRSYHARTQPGVPLYYLDHRPLSASFHSGGVASAVSLAETGDLGRPYWLAVHKTVGNRAPAHCHYAYRPATGEFDLYFCDD
ncbi:MAG: hypothetical protein HKN58_04870 [Xanthomonadales bacterium]|nr:hypothetical protein [Xanthomonadales bacterium]